MATEHQLSYGITQCYLPLAQLSEAHLTAARHVATQFTYTLKEWKAEFSLVYLSADNHDFK